MKYQRKSAILLASTLLVISVLHTGCEARERPKKKDKTAAAETSRWQTMEVKASSYTLDPKETRPNNGQIGAFGHKLTPGKKIIAVSRDLLRAGLVNGTQVRIEGLDGTYTVRDKMHRRWREKIDILFAKRKRALNWGVQTVTIRYRPPTDR